MNPQITTPIAQPIFYNAVSQLDKTQLPTLKRNASNILTVSQAQLQKPCAPTHARKQKIQQQQNKIAITKFLKMANELFVFVNVEIEQQHYVNAIFEIYTKADFEICVKLIKAFAILRCNQNINSQIITNDNDFYNAFFIMKQRTIAHHNQHQSVYDEVYNCIKKHFANANFTTQNIFYRFKYSLNAIQNILRLMVKENILHETLQNHHATIYTLIS